MKELARDNMPFMALEIHGLEDVSLKKVTKNYFAKYNLFVNKLLKILPESAPHCQHEAKRTGYQDHIGPGKHETGCHGTG